MAAECLSCVCVFVPPTHMYAVNYERLTFGSLKATTASALHLKHGKW